MVVMQISENRESTHIEYQKSQLIRLVDVFLIAPICIYAGVKASQLPQFIRTSLIIIGVATFYYNGKNYLINKKRDDEQK
jgi:hypothetical protein